MVGRSDQLHSHQFAWQRVIKALTLRDPDAAASPTRRAAGAVFASVMVALLALAAVGVYGVLRPTGNPSWRDGNAVIIEQETGARFVYREGVLYPVLNHASALLILGTATAPVLVPHAALAQVPRGVPLGIPGAPDPLPAVGDLVAGPWQVCSRPPGDPGREGVESVLRVAAPVSAQVLGERAVLARDAGGGLHLLWRGHRYPLRNPAVALVALGWSSRPPTPVASAALNAIPVGPELAPMSIPRRGEPSALPGHRVGEVFVVHNEGGQRQYAVALVGGLATITQVQADLLLAEPGNQLDGAITLTAAQYVAAPQAGSLVPQGEAVAPAHTPALVEPPARGEVCATFGDAGSPPRLGLLPPTSPAWEVRVPGSAAATTVDWVAVPPGHGALVRSITGVSGNGPLALVSDLGIRYPLPSPEVLAALGYAEVSPQSLPSALVSLLPTGTELDPAVAASPAQP